MPRLFFRSVSLLAFCLVGCGGGPKPAPSPEGRRPGMVGRMLSSAHKLNPFRGKPAVTSKASSATFKGLEMKMSVEPLTPNLGEVRQITVKLRLQNRGKRLVQLDFPTTQRIEVIVRNTAGGLVEQWSEDQAFQNEPGLVAINPGERLEYSANISTRDFAAGQDYIVEGFFPNYESLRATAKVTPTR
jgi:hypothetical protein